MNSNTEEITPEDSQAFLDDIKAVCYKHKIDLLPQFGMKRLTDEDLSLVKNNDESL